MRRLGAGLVLLALALTPPPAEAQLPAVLAQKAAAPPAAAAPAQAPPPVSKAEAARLLGILNDPKQRASFTATLQTMLKADQAQTPAKAAPLQPDGLGAQLIAQGSQWVATLSSQTVDLGQALGNLPAVWAFTVHNATDPDARARVLDAGWRLALALGLAGLAMFLARRLLRRFREPIAAAATPPTDTQAEPEHHARRFRAIRALRRLPFALLRLLLDLVPIGVFLAVGMLGATIAPAAARPVLLIAIRAALAVQLADAAVRLIASPGEPRLRLVHLSEGGARAALVWTHWLVLVAALGTAVGQIGLIFGLRHSAYQALLKAVALIDHILLVVIVLRCRRPVADRIAHSHRPESVIGRMRARLAAVWHLVAIFYIMAFWLVWAVELRDGFNRFWRFSLESIGILLGARLLAILLLGGLDRGLAPSSDAASRHPGLMRRAAAYHGILRGAVNAVLAACTLLALLEVWGLEPLRVFTGGALGARILSAASTTLVAGLVALGVWEAVNGGAEYQVARLTREGQVQRAVRLRTLLPIFRTMLALSLLVVFGLTALSEIGVNIAPLLAGAGIVGVAIGFGSQKLVQDFITGLFLLLENAMQVGDWVTVAGLSGAVEDLSIRTMRLRAGDGSVHIVPFSSVSTVTNVNRGIGNAAVSVAIPVEEDVDRAAEALADIAREMRDEPRYEEVMRSDLQLWGVDKVEAGVVTIVGQIVCTDQGRWGVQREFNRRVTLRFKQLGIRLATPVQTIIRRDEHWSPPRAGAIQAQPDATVVRESPPPAALGNSS
jgi:moderate conductance mechanosensitive channel